MTVSRVIAAALLAERERKREEGEEEIAYEKVHSKKSTRWLSTAGSSETNFLR